MGIHLQGATIQINGETGCMEIARVLHGGAADRSGMQIDEISWWMTDLLINILHCSFL